jgi:hypothetical protein
LRESGSVTFDLARRSVRRLIGVRRAAEAASVLHHPARSVGLIGGVGLAFDEQLLLEAALGLTHALRARARDRLGLRLTFLIQAALGLAQPAAATLRGAKLRRQLIAAGLAELLILERIDALGLFEDLARELLVVAVGVMGGVGVHLGAVDRDHAHRHQARLGADREHLAEQLRQRVLVALAKASDRGVIGALVCGYHAVGDVLGALALDHARGALPLAVGVQQQRDHHRRLVRGAAVAVMAVGGVER